MIPLPPFLDALHRERATLKEHAFAYSTHALLKEVVG